MTIIVFLALRHQRLQYIVDSFTNPWSVFSDVSSKDGDPLGDPVSLSEPSGLFRTSEEDTSTTMDVAIVGALGLSSIFLLKGISGV